MDERKSRQKKKGGEEKSPIGKKNEENPSASDSRNPLHLKGMENV